jgi:hypothetical protein
MKTSNESNSEVAEVRTQLDLLLETQKHLLAEFDKSMAIQEMWPNAFEHGAITTYVRGNCRTGMRWTVTFGNGEEAHMDLKLVPVLLWPEQVKDDIREAGPRFPYWNILCGYEKEKGNG